MMDAMEGHSCPAGVETAGPPYSSCNYWVLHHNYTTWRGSSGHPTFVIAQLS